MYGDTRTDSQKRQQGLWQLLGTLQRTRITVEALARSSRFYNLAKIKITPQEQRILDAAAYVLQDMASRAQQEMQSLPSKKKTAKAARLAKLQEPTKE